MGVDRLQSVGRVENPALVHGGNVRAGSRDRVLAHMPRAQHGETATCFVP